MAAMPVAGADVLLLAWPNDEVLDALGDGDPVPNLVAGRAATDGAGGFAVSVDPARIPADYRSEVGHVDFELHVAASDAEVMWNFSAGAAASGLGTLAVGSAWENPRVEAEGSPAELGVGPAHLSIDFEGETASIVETGDEPAKWENDDGELL